MDTVSIMKTYITALEEALVHSGENSGFHVKPAIDYIDGKIQKEIDFYIESNYENHKILFDLEAEYFLAKSHYEPDEGYILDLKSRLQRCINNTKILLGI